MNSRERKDTEAVVKSTASVTVLDGDPVVRKFHSLARNGKREKSQRREY